ncbi:MAG: aminodeoxychorismate synthase component I [Deltaproteobacteria bacterium]|nr:aminodeoxychorismate synthase component I [Deltaproteobacteria bacterium]MBW1946551.1 aminodeoxychorismate synthase component I [Deltaproteobacteria bacterium]MBW1966100.1 aminodeoxychorismate synthase component I [Deltaproteobacteria bacterium]MBW2097649.1 aminodeoxychorismate synthase component I [Deltaproteobacteria bacterium]
MAMNLPYVTGRPYPLDAASILKGLTDIECFVFLETSRVAGEENTSYLFLDPIKILTAYGPDDLEPLYKSMETAIDRGYYLAGWWAYEWGYALEPKLYHLLDALRPKAPLVWLGVFENPKIWIHKPDAPFCPLKNIPDIRKKLGPLKLEVEKERYIRAIDCIKDYIAGGHTYQVNYTLRGRFDYTGLPSDLYLSLRARQSVSYGAVIRNRKKWLLSLSPELFFRLEGRKIWSKPMKGTLKRGRTIDEDRELARFLANDPKNRAENIMIVDLLRNDIGRLSLPGTVRVPEIFTVERYETLFQMTSRIEGEIRPGTSWHEIFKALFPCGSVTGAPKIRTMEIISEIESSPRGVYTGAIGFISPRRRAVLNVAIRTVVLDGESGELGIGSGITIDSDPAREYDECRLKARFLTDPLYFPHLKKGETRKDFSLIETMRWDPVRREQEVTEGYFLLERHLERLSQSAHYFAFYLDLKKVRRELAEFARGLYPERRPHRVRMLLGRDGSLTVSASALSMQEKQVYFDLSAKAVDSQDPFLYHKTTYRPLFTEEYQRAKTRGLFDCVFVNERGELTEGSISNIFLEINGGLVTPPVSSGLLNGTFRQELVEQGRASEHVLYPDDMNKAAAIYLGNSVRGLLRASCK